ncbi:MAG: hypothetical protein A2W61_08490 [Deltaproteobacteria bacterium RIFCSPLOWO2_01_44_7]|nr:MAG: hypothetical protein A2712_10985 [Deltaproteobacteria bacterium RIFCSPHIGHO2_01_FULL_43_49]OGQ16578.1 MAG: hypothetical protein A3D22_06685 [Deltaproteobacteria bacterium RIFCSPHIGHO2_02_FULL_44_53]OGQ28394.1 MAG: hypothetical protein A3D98_06390 [Deltaproteobacteria bacterium RIFCSPHIGHO2_12_FULL_44_21]OGQ32465.1 MAG: hypothetical protein A2979_10950 [Deltaproteobacteria bacterium RIFCSPLOWO2_01_FULL_45_74]OGQ39119.1 MAG: hypothetical protein A2W61_08490 [Deltaproteobacteria bacterium 
MAGCEDAQATGVPKFFSPARGRGKGGDVTEAGDPRSGCARKHPKARAEGCKKHDLAKGGAGFLPPCECKICDKPRRGLAQILLRVEREIASAFGLAMTNRFSIFILRQNFYRFSLNLRWNQVRTSW